MKRQKMTRAAGRVLLALVASFALVMAGCGQPGDDYDGDDKNKTEQTDGDGNNTNGGGGGNTNTGSGDGNGQQTGGNTGDNGGNAGGSGDGDGGDNGNGGGSGSGEVDDSKDTFGVVSWGDIDFLGDGVEGEELGQKYKIHIETNAANPEATNLKKVAASNDNASIHVVCGSANIITSLGKGNFSTSGADLYLYLTNFKAKETRFTITDNGTEYTCYVYYADGTGTEVIDIEYSNDPAVGDDGNIDWSGETWIGDGVGGVTNQYKIIAPVGNVVNIQISGSAVKAAIYIYGLPTFASCSLDEGEYIGGGDVVYLYIDAFKYKETKFTITVQDGSEYEFWVYNDKGEEGIDDRTSSAGEDTTE
ncbi:MAG: hypothetical protein J1F14_07140 [Treponema sp.]|nr:hypothetical protein [Treponema sp.]